MNEMSIALNIIDIVTEETAKANSNKVSEIEIEIGTISGVEISALESAFEIAVYNTILENSLRKFIIIQAMAKCLDCTHTYPLSNFYEPCPNCKSPTITILQGTELKVKSINID